MVVNITDAVTLSWMEPNPTNGIIIEYRVQYRRCDQPTSSRSTISNITTVIHTVSGLVPDNEYCFRVRAFTRQGSNGFTSEVRAIPCESQILHVCVII